MSSVGTDSTATDRVLTPDSAPSMLAARAGGKARSLFRLAAAGLPVPRCAAIGSDVLASFRSSAGLDGVIAGALADLVDGNEDEVASRIARAFAAAEPDATTLEAVAAAYERVGAGPVAVRSSGLDEDGSVSSFAGQYESYLNVSGMAAISASVKACWASAYSARALTYRLLRGLPAGIVDMGVLVQEMVAPQRSGVMFTANPVSGDRDELVINAAFGLGEHVVSGAVEADTITVDRRSGATKQAVVGYKSERLDAVAEGRLETRPVDAEARDSLSLAADQVGALADLGDRIEELYGAPQDIEWAIDDAGVWILQSRPITTLPPAGGGELRIWDNSNIIESYGEIVAPLTYSFARQAYQRVYHDYAELLGVPERHVERMDDWLRNMLGYFNGHVYYNMLNWYKVIRLLPFYAVNRQVLELSIGVQESLSDELAAEQRPFEAASRTEEIAVRTVVATRFFFHFFTLERLVRGFLRDFYRVYDEFDALDYADRPAHEIYPIYRDVERRLLSRWGRMIVLEASIGLAYGALHVLNTRWLADAPEWLRWEVTKSETGDADVESAQPARRLTLLADIVRADAGLRSHIAALEPEEVDAALRGSAEPAAAALVAEVDRYLDEFGYRNVNELKLEEPDLREDPSMLFSMLKAAVEQPAATSTPAPGDSADAYLDTHLRGWRRSAYELVRRKVRSSLASRERVRFCRTRAFGMARRMFKAMGEDLARRGVLATPRDVFYLRLDELRGYFEGTVAHRELAPLVQLRKAQERENRELTPPPRFTTRGDVFGADMRLAWEAEAGATGARDGGAVLSGIPCSPGVAEAAARVVDRPSDVSGDVLVAYRTDPGWIGVLSSASALLIERGSPLTHVAIVARELRIPTVVQVPGLTRRVRDGMRLRVDGSAGTITIIGEEAQA
jgi:phosphohistidine swiveling domain-containing protein